MKRWVIFGMVFLALVLAAACAPQVPEGCEAYEDTEACTMQYDPVCATLADGTEQTMGNECVACTSEEDIVSIRPGECVNETDPEPNQTLPGQNGSQQNFSAVFTECTEPRPEVCTMQYDPVCAFVNGNYETKGNACVACSDADVLRFTPGACQEKLFVICEETQTGFSAEEYAEQNNGICVDACPDGFNPYTTQIGVQLCIQHYGEEEIMEWPVCERSNETCNCVRTTETTTGEQIEDAQYRCVPDQYASRLLFTSGQDRLDEDGQQSVMIA